MRGPRCAPNGSGTKSCIRLRAPIRYKSPNPNTKLPSKATDGAPKAARSSPIAPGNLNHRGRRRSVGAVVCPFPMRSTRLERRQALREGGTSLSRCCCIRHCVQNGPGKPVHRGMRCRKEGLHIPGIVCKANLATPNIAGCVAGRKWASHITCQPP